jgi:hypothetical protein
MALDLTGIHAAVQAENSVDASVVVLLSQLAAKIDAASKIDDDDDRQAEIDAITASMRNNAQTLANAIVANTPAPAATPNTPTTTTAAAATAVHDSGTMTTPVVAGTVVAAPVDATSDPDATITPVADTAVDGTAKTPSSETE